MSGDRFVSSAPDHEHTQKSPPNPTPIDPFTPMLTSSADCVVHTAYNPEAPPEHPGTQWTRFICISDTHSATFEVPDGDVLLHAGDLSRMGKVAHLKKTMDWLYALPHPRKIIIAGNHDLALDTDWYNSHWDEFHGAAENTEEARVTVTGSTAKECRVTYLEYTSAEFQVRNGGKKWKVYGSPGSPWFGGWAFNYERGKDAEALHSKIPSDTDILLTHGPPGLILDRVNSGESVGCEELRQRLDVIRPSLHVFGHIHEDRGVMIHEWPNVSNAKHVSRTVFVNAANTPSGKIARIVLQHKNKLDVGGWGFQPLIVDMYDPGN